MLAKTPVLLLALLFLPGRAIAGDRFFVITDSHGVGAFGEEIARALRQRPDTAFGFWASGGSAPLQWINAAFYTACGYHEDSTTPAAPRRCNAHFFTPKLADLLKAAGPEPADERRIAVIALGSNFGDKPEDYGWQLRSTVLLLNDALKGSDRCVWIGPPEMPHFGAANVQFKYDLIQKAIAQSAQQTGKAPCDLIDSRPYAHYPTPADPKHETPDGVHYHLPSPYWKFPEGEAAAVAWARGVLVELDSILAPAQE